jgi:hypothetical protein
MNRLPAEGLDRKLFLFNGYFGRLNYREDLISLFKIHSLDRTSRDNRRYVSSRSSDDKFGYDFVGNNFLDRARQAVSDTRAHSVVFRILSSDCPVSCGSRHRSEITTPLINVVAMPLWGVLIIEAARSGRRTAPWLHHL